MKKIIYCLLALTLTACGGEVVNEYSRYSCYYNVRMDYIYDTPLIGAINGTNFFATMSVNSINKGRYQLISQMYGSEKNTKDITLTGVDINQTRTIGLNNGLIVGRSSFQEGQLYVFDQICPNCYSQNLFVNDSYMLKLSDSMNAECGKCKRKYGLINGGVVVAGEQGTKLFRYHAGTDATIFWVSNPQ